MGWVRSLKALAISEERRLAGQLAGLLYLCGAATAPLVLLLPGTVRDHWYVVVAISAVGAAWGLACLRLVPWERTHPLVSHFSSSMGFPITAAVVAATGGAGSAARFYLLFILVYCGYFYLAREAWAYVAGCVVVHALPLAYDADAMAEGFAAEAVVIAVTYVVLGGLIIAGKKLLVDLREQAVELSLRDPLTGLANRRALLDLLERRMNDLGGGRAFGLVIVDLDDFKEANTLHGHPGGDRALLEAAAALRAAARDGDTVARIGGDEFAIVAEAPGPHGAEALGERVLESIREANPRLDLPGFALRASVGWALYPDHGSTVDEVVAAADLALRGAKLGGKDRLLPAPEPVAQAPAELA